jgi:hypothetical protein
MIGITRLDRFDKDLRRGRSESGCFFPLATVKADRRNEDRRKNELVEFHSRSADSPQFY